MGLFAEQVVKEMGIHGQARLGFGPGFQGRRSQRQDFRLHEGEGCQHLPKQRLGFAGHARPHLVELVDFVRDMRIHQRLVGAEHKLVGSLQGGCQRRRPLAQAALELSHFGQAGLEIVQLGFPGGIAGIDALAVPG